MYVVVAKYHSAMDSDFDKLEEFEIEADSPEEAHELFERNDTADPMVGSWTVREVYKKEESNTNRQG